MTATSSPGVFRVGHVFQRGDLPLFVTDLAGNAVTPYKVTFTIFYQSSGDVCARQVGPSDRTPVQAAIGEYYVSGVACGQSGQWYVEWKLQEGASTSLVSERMGFQIFDSSRLSPSTYISGSSCGCSCGCSSHAGCQWGCRNPCLRTTSCGKYGW